MKMTLGKRLSLIYITVFLVSFLTTMGILYAIASGIIKEMSETQLTRLAESSYSIAYEATDASIKNYLRGIAKKTYDVVVHYYKETERGTMTRDEAWNTVRSYIVDPTIGKIGETGYLAGVNTKGVLVIHPKSEGVDASGAAFMKQAITQKNGYLQYDWKNKGETKERAKAGWLTYFEPWDLIVWASSYREEFLSLIDENAIKSRLKDVRVGETGYAFIIDSKGNAVLHPNREGENLYDVKDNNGKAFFKEMCETALAESEGSNATHSVHTITYTWKHAERGRFERKVATYVYFKELDWIIGVSGWENEFNAPLVHMGVVMLIAILALLIVIPLVNIIIARSIARPVARLANTFESMRDGDLTVSLPKRDAARGDEIGTLARGFHDFAEALRKTFRFAKKNVDTSRTQSATLSEHMTESAATIQEMSASLISMKKNVEEQLRQFNETHRRNANEKDVAASVSSGIRNAIGKTEALTGKIREQVSSVTQTASAVDEMMASIENVTTITKEAKTSSETLITSARSGRATLEQTLTNMNALLEAIGAIHAFIGVIVDIAQQTNLLAMNASIEAAHAGEHGRGFAVVAEEIRKLSDQSNQQAEDATKLLKNIEDKVTSTTKELNNTEENFKTLLSETEKVTGVIGDVDFATHEQSNAASEISSAINTISIITEDVREEYAHMADMLQSMTSTLQTLDTSSAETESSLTVLGEISESIMASISEISTGAKQMNQSVEEIVRLTQKTSEGIGDLEKSISVYTTEKRGVPATQERKA